MRRSSGVSSTTPTATVSRARWGGVSTVYIGGVYEQSGSAATFYYESGAMRREGYAENNGVFYLLSDQLKSTSVIVTQAGAEVTRQHYYPYGGNREPTNLFTAPRISYCSTLYISHLPALPCSAPKTHTFFP